MFSKVKSKDDKSKLLSLLTFIIDATKSEAGKASVPLKEVAALAKAEPGFVEYDAKSADKDGMVLVSATQKAIDAVAGVDAPAATTEEKPAEKQAVDPVALKTQFERGTLDVLPEVKRGNPKSDSYPFAELKSPAELNGKYDYFFVPSTESRPRPSKTLASTVASATKRFKDIDGRVFTLRKKLGADGKTEIGALVIRSK